MSVANLYEHFQSKNLSREVKKGKKETALQCKHNGGASPYGYSVNKDGYYEINEKEAEAVRLIFKLTAEGYTMLQISKLLEKQGTYTRNNKTFSPSTINSILHNEKYSGVYIYAKNIDKKVNGKRVVTPNPKALRIEDGVPAIVDKELFYSVQEILERRSKRSSQCSYCAKELYLLQGLIKCGYCGYAMYGGSGRTGRNKKLYQYYEDGGRKKHRANCRTRRIDRDMIENLVIDYIESEILSDEALQKAKDIIIEGLKKTEDSAPQKIKSLEKELAQVEKKLKKLFDALMAGIEAISLKEQIESLDKEKQNLRNQINLLQKQSNMSNSISFTDLDAYIIQFRNIRSHPRAYQKEIINRFISEVIVYDSHNNPDEPTKDTNLIKDSIVIKVRNPFINSKGEFLPKKQDTNHMVSTPLKPFCRDISAIFDISWYRR